MCNCNSKLVEIDKNVYELKKHLITEIGEDLAYKFLGSLKDRENLVKTYENLGKLWAPLILGWYNWLIKQNVVNPKIMMRDGKILTFNKDFKKLYLNRKNMGIEDEFDSTIKKAKIENSLIVKYLKQEDVYDKYFTFIDSGCWGSIVFDLNTKQQFSKMNFKPLFFYSHNPNIKGFLNDLMEKNIIRDEKFCELLNDSLESAFLNYEKRTEKFEEKNNKIFPIIEEENCFIAKLGKKALESLFVEIAEILKLEPKNKEIMLKEGLSTEELSKYLLKIDIYKIIKDGIKKLKDAQEKAYKGEFTGILPINSPTSKSGPMLLTKWKMIIPLITENIEKIKENIKIIDKYDLFLSKKQLQKFNLELDYNLNDKQKVKEI